MTRDEFLTAYAARSAFTPGELRALGNHPYECADGGWELCGRGVWQNPERLALVLGDPRYRLSPICPNDPEGHARMIPVGLIHDVPNQGAESTRLVWACPYCNAEETTDDV